MTERTTGPTGDAATPLPHDDSRPAAAAPRRAHSALDEGTTPMGDEQQHKIVPISSFANVTAGCTDDIHKMSVQLVGQLGGRYIEVEHDVDAMLELANILGAFSRAVDRRVAALGDRSDTPLGARADELASASGGQRP